DRVRLRIALVHRLNHVDRRIKAVNIFLDLDEFRPVPERIVRLKRDPKTRKLTSEVAAMGIMTYLRALDVDVSIGADVLTQFQRPFPHELSPERHGEVASSLGREPLHRAACPQNLGLKSLQLVVRSAPMLTGHDHP